MEHTIDTVTLRHHTGNWRPDPHAIVVYCPINAPQEYQVRLGDQCYRVSPHQYEQYVATQNERVRAAWAFESRVDDHNRIKRLVHFHPAKITVWVDDVQGYQTRLLEPHESLSEMFGTLVPVNIVGEGRP